MDTADQAKKTDKPFISRRKFISGAAFAGLAVAGYSDMRWIEPGWLKVHRVVVSMPDLELKKPIRIMHLSDLHYGAHIKLPFIQKAFRIGLDEKPDIVCLTGDYVTHEAADVSGFRDTFKLLSDKVPCFASFGNHDGGAWASPHGGYKTLDNMKQILTDAGINVLHNQMKSIDIHGRTIEFIGLGDMWARDGKPEKAFADITSDNEKIRIVLSHNPDYKVELADYPWQLMLCGHTHGGQLSLPFIGQPFAPVHDKGYVYGLNKWNTRWIYTTSGVGNLHGMRLNCRPEVAILEIK